MRQHAHDLDADLGEVLDHAEEQVLGHLQGGQLALGGDGRGARHVAPRIAISPTMSFLVSVATVIVPEGGLDLNVGRALQDDEGGVADFALAAEDLARP